MDHVKQTVEFLKVRETVYFFMQFLKEKNFSLMECISIFCSGLCCMVENNFQDPEIKKDVLTKLFDQLLDQNTYAISEDGNLRFKSIDFSNDLNKQKSIDNKMYHEVDSSNLVNIAIDSDGKECDCNKCDDCLDAISYEINAIFVKSFPMINKISFSCLTDILARSLATQMHLRIPIYVYESFFEHFLSTTRLYSNELGENKEIEEHFKKVKRDHDKDP